MSEGSINSDKGLGIGLALVAVTILGAAMLYGGAAQIDRAWGFGLAMGAAIVAVAALHLFD